MKWSIAILFLAGSFAYADMIYAPSNSFTTPIPAAKKKIKHHHRRHHHRAHPTRPSSSSSTTGMVSAPPASSCGEKDTARDIRTSAVLDSDVQGTVCDNVNCTAPRQPLIPNMSTPDKYAGLLIAPDCLKIAEQLQPVGNGLMKRRTCTSDGSKYESKPAPKACDADGNIANVLAVAIDAGLRCINAKLTANGLAESELISAKDAFKMIDQESTFVTNASNGGMMQLMESAVKEFERGPAYDTHAGTSVPYKVWHTPTPPGSKCDTFETKIPATHTPTQGISKGYHKFSTATCALLDPVFNPDRSLVYGLSTLAATKIDMLKRINKKDSLEILHDLGLSEDDIAATKAMMTEMAYNQGRGGGNRIWAAFLVMADSMFDRTPPHLPKIKKLIETAAKDLKLVGDNAYITNVDATHATFLRQAAKNITRLKCNID